MTRDETIERLRAWAARAENEAQQADTPQNRAQWLAQQQVLAGLASLLAEQGGGLDDHTLWVRTVAERERALADWQSRHGGLESSALAGQVAAYDVALTAFTDLSGRVWPRAEPHVG